VETGIGDAARHQPGDHEDGENEAESDRCTGEATFLASKGDECRRRSEE
jgi:hypothetical protein